MMSDHNINYCRPRPDQKVQHRVVTSSINYSSGTNIINERRSSSSQNVLPQTTRTQTPPLSSTPKEDENNIGIMMLPTVFEICEEIWHCPLDDYEGAAGLLEMLRQAIASERVHDRYDPSEVFLCIQGAALRFHTNWQQRNRNSMQKEPVHVQHRQQQQEEETVKSSLSSVGDNHQLLALESNKDVQERTVTPETDVDTRAIEIGLGRNNPRNMQNECRLVDDDINEITGSLSTLQTGRCNDNEGNMPTCSDAIKFSENDRASEQVQSEAAAWSVWEESMLSAALLASTCVGPRWHEQLKVQREWIQRGSTGIIAKHQQPPQYFLWRGERKRAPAVASDGNDSSSTLGMSSTDRQPSIDGSDEGRESASPGSLTSYPQSAGFSNTSKWQPHIPEVLPAAMLRFAASASSTAIPPLRNSSSVVHREEIDSVLQEERQWLIRRQRIGEAQRELVLSFCCTSSGSDDSNGMKQEWAIPSADEPLTNLVNFWYETASSGWPSQRDVTDQSKDATEDSSRTPDRAWGNTGTGDILWSDAVDIGALDWWFTLQVTRAVNDLVSEGWHPPSVSGLGDKSVSLLFHIVERGLYLESADLKCDVDEIHQEAREERLAAASSAAEAMASLATLGSREQLPESMVSYASSTLCHLLAIADPSISLEDTSRLFPEIDGPQVMEEAEVLLHERETFQAQRESCLADIAELLWALLAQSSSEAVESICNILEEALLAATTIRSSIARADRASRDDAILIAGAAIRFAGSAFFGNPPHVMGMPYLRIFWVNLLESIGKVVSVLHEGSDEGKQPGPTSVLVLVHEVAVAMRRMVDGELLHCSAVLSPSEWEAFVHVLSRGLIPWLDQQAISPFTDTVVHHEPLWCIRQRRQLCGKLQHEIIELISQMKGFLLSCSRPGSSPFHLILDDLARHDLHLSLLRYSATSHHHAHTTSLALAVVKSWTAAGILPYRRCDKWRSAQDLLSEVFAVYSDSGVGYPGGFVFSALVRRQALFSIMHEDEDESTKRLPDEIQSDVQSQQSIFALTKNVRELHLELVNDIIPYLTASLNTTITPSSIRLPRAVVYPAPPHSRSVFRRTDEIHDEFLLQRYSVALFGKVFRSITGDRHQRLFVIRLLQVVAERTCEDVHANVFRYVFRSCVEAIRQLSLCLMAPFHILPHTHESFPTVVCALQSVIQVHSWTIRNGPQRSHHNVLAAGVMLVLAAVEPLTRLSMSGDGRLQLRGMNVYSKWVTKKIMHLISEEGEEPGSEYYQAMNQEHGSSWPIKAPFIYVSDSTRLSDMATIGEMGEQANGTTIISLDSIVSAIVSATEILEVKRDVSEIVKGRSVFSAIPLEELWEYGQCLCLSTFHSLLMSRVTFNPESNLAYLFLCRSNCSIGQSSKVKDANTEALVALCEACVQGRFVLSSDSEGEFLEDKVNPRGACQKLIELCASDDSTLRKHACRGMSAILHASTEHHFFLLFCQHLLPLITSILVKIIHGILRNSPEHTLVIEKWHNEFIPIMTLLYDGLCLARSKLQLPALKLREEVICLCQQLLASSGTPGTGLTRQGQIIALECAVVGIETMTASEACAFLPGFEEQMRVLEAQLHEDNNCHKISLGRLHELLHERLLHRCTPIQREREQCTPEVSVHHYLASQLNRIESFRTESHSEDGKQMSSEWINGNCILTCRVGARESRCRGWMELVLRSPTSCSRHLVRLGSPIAASCPESPSLFIDKESRVHSVEGVFDFDDSGGTSQKKYPFGGKTAALLQAKDVLRQFDTLFDASASGYSWAKDEPSAKPQSEVSVMKERVEANNSNDTALTAPDNLIRSSAFFKWLILFFDSEAEATKAALEVEAMLFCGDWVVGAEEVPTYLNQGKFSLGSFRRLKSCPKLARAISILDRTVPFQTDKVALFYVGTDTHYGEMRSRKWGAYLNATQISPGFLAFSRELGDVVSCRHLKYFSGGLDTSSFSVDGNFALTWNDGQPESRGTCGSINTMVLFHDLTLMPLSVNGRKRHVGNDLVHILYFEEALPIEQDREESERSEEVVWRSGDFGIVSIFVDPISCDHVRVSVEARENIDDNEIIPEISHMLGAHVVETNVAPVFVRQLAVRACIACRSTVEDKMGLATNWEERYEQIQLIRRFDEIAGASANPSKLDT